MVKVILGVLLSSMLTGCGALALFYPPMDIYLREVNGKAQLAEAQFNRQIMVTEAEAKKEAAKSEAAAEVERAKGVAEANQIIGASLSGNEAYLRYIWLQTLRDGNNKVIYIPTEANLPILEAQRK